MKLKKAFISSSILLALTTTPIAESVTHAQTSYGEQSIGENAKVIKRTEDAYSKYWGITQNIQFDFIDDNKFNKDALIIKAQGHIQSRTQYRWLNNNQATRTAQMIWPSKYHVNINVKDNDVNVVNFLPKNNISSVDVSQTTGYSVGGSFNSNNSGGLNAGYSYSKSISYNQQSYRSEVKNQSSKSIGWDVAANEFQLDGHRFAGSAKDALVHWYTYGNTPREHFWEDTELPVLVKSGFNPSFITTVSREKNSKSETSVFEITYGRTLDITNAWRRSVHIGANTYLATHREYDVFKNRNYTVKYEVNWKNHTVRVIN